MWTPSGGESSVGDDFSLVSENEPDSPPRHVRRRLNFGTPRRAESAPVQPGAPRKKPQAKCGYLPAKPRTKHVTRARRPNDRRMFGPGRRLLAKVSAFAEAAPKPFVVSAENTVRVLTDSELAEIDATLARVSGVDKYVPDLSDGDVPPKLSRHSAVIFNQEGVKVGDKDLVQAMLHPTLIELHGPAQSKKSSTPCVHLAVAPVIKTPVILLAALKQAGVQDMQNKLVRNRGPTMTQADVDAANALLNAELDRVGSDLAQQAFGEGKSAGQADPHIVYMDGRENRWTQLMEQEGVVEMVRKGCFDVVVRHARAMSAETDGVMWSHR